MSQHNISVSISGANTTGYGSYVATLQGLGAYPFQVGDPLSFSPSLAKGTALEYDAGTRELTFSIWSTAQPAASDTVTSTGSLSATVYSIDTDPSLTSYVGAGHVFYVPSDTGSTSYVVASVPTRSKFTITAPYGGSTVTDTAGRFQTSVTPHNNIPLIERGDQTPTQTLHDAILTIDSLIAGLDPAEIPAIVGVSPVQVASGTIGGITGTFISLNAITSTNSQIVVTSGTDQIKLTGAVPPAIIAGGDITVVSGSNTIRITDNNRALLGSDFINVASGTNTITISADAIVAGSSNLAVSSGTNTVSIDLSSTPSVTTLTATTVTGTTGNFAGTVNAQNVNASVQTFGTTVSGGSGGVRSASVVEGQSAAFSTSMQAATVTGTTGQFAGAISAQSAVFSTSATVSGGVSLMHQGVNAITTSGINPLQGIVDIVGSGIVNVKKTGSGKIEISAPTAAAGGGGIASVQADSNPVLGGNLNANSFNITGAGTISGTGLTTGGTVSAQTGSFSTGLTISGLPAITRQSYEEISHVYFTNAPSISFGPEVLATGVYHRFIFHENIRVTTDDVFIGHRVSFNGGATYHAGNNYTYTGNYVSATTSTPIGTSDTQWHIGQEGAGENVGNAVNEGFAGTFQILHIGASNCYPMAKAEGSYLDAGTGLYSFDIGLHVAIASGINGLQVYPESGNITGEITVIGIRR